jgi:hypothetical protein
MKDSDYPCGKSCSRTILPEANTDVPRWFRWAAFFVLVPGVVLAGVGIKFLVDPEDHHPVAGAIFVGIEIGVFIVMVAFEFVNWRRKRKLHAE